MKRRTFIQGTVASILAATLLPGNLPKAKPPLPPLYITSGGNVGLGVSSPSTTFHIIDGKIER